VKHAVRGVTYEHLLSGLLKLGEADGLDKLVKMREQAWTTAQVNYAACSKAMPFRQQRFEVLAAL